MLARDAAPSGCFAKLAPILKERGHSVLMTVGHGKPIKTTLPLIEDMVRDTDVVFLGMSSSSELSELELLAGDAAELAGVPYGFYGDVPGCFARAREGAWFRSLAENTSFYCGVDDADARAARFVFPNALCVGTGNPLREEMAFPVMMREQVRAKLGVPSDVALVLAPGNKTASFNMATWTILMGALAMLHWKGKKMLLVLTPHPGDRTPHAVDDASGVPMQLYEELVKYSPIPTDIVPAEVLTTSNILPGADLVVEFASSVGIEAAYQNIPVITLALEPALRRLEEIQGSRTLEAVTLGISKLVHGDVHVLERVIARLLTEDGFAPMRQRQREKCPRPKERGAALRAIVETLEQVALK